ncbi:MAG: hypothetical protein ACI8Y7_001019 [Candidatus Woesearchaeota archaeon]|jgi:hypothetical protein
MREEFEQLQKDEKFLAWKKEHPDVFLAHCFLMNHKAVSPNWQFGYAQGENITVFDVGEGVEKQEQEEAFKRPDSQIMPIDLKDVTVEYEQAFEIAQKTCGEKAPSEPVNTTICILQNIKPFGVVWNMTYVTMAFKTVNIKVDAKSGEVVAADVDSLLKLGTPE